MNSIQNTCLKESNMLRVGGGEVGSAKFSLPRVNSAGPEVEERRASRASEGYEGNRASEESEGSSQNEGKDDGSSAAYHSRLPPLTPEKALLFYKHRPETIRRGVGLKGRRGTDLRGVRHKEV